MCYDNNTSSIEIYVVLVWESRCHIPSLRCRTRKMRDHVTVAHLHNLFLREVPCAPDITRVVYL